MRAFAELYEELDTTTSTNLKVDAMALYFRSAAPADAAWATYILSGRRLKRFIGPALIGRWLVETAHLPEWLVEETYATVGDLAETIALLMDVSDKQTGALEDLSLAGWIEARLLPLRAMDDDARRERITGWWRSLPYRECFLVNKLLTGSLRVGVSELLVTRALSQALGVTRSDIARRLMGEWEPGEPFWKRLGSAEETQVDPSTPYPFFLASAHEGDIAALGAPSDYLIEWKWDGIRGQLIHRQAQVFLWSRGEDLVTERFPEVVDAAHTLPEGTVLDGELVAWKHGAVLPFAHLQTRIGRKKLSAQILERVPVHFLAYDLLEEGGQDLRGVPQLERRARLESLLTDARGVIGISPEVRASSWEELATLRSVSRDRGVEGLMLKARTATYGTGRQRGAWWKWKIEPYTFDGVMLYAQPGHGRRSNLYTDYTFGVWQDGALVPVAKAYSGLSNAEILELDRWIRAHTIEKFGPVRSVEPTEVFELAFEGIAASTRHKSGIAMRFPRIARRRPDKPAAEADTIENLRAVLAAHTSAGAPHDA